MRLVSLSAVAMSLAGAGSVHAGISYLSQARSISVSTTADGNAQTVAAPDFAPFVTSLAIQTSFNAANGGVVLNSARSEINCVSDPNAILANGRFAAEGGIDDDGDEQSGEGAVDLFFTFTVTEATPFRLIASPRLSADPRDEFEIELANLSGGEDPFHLPDGAPAQSVDVSGVLQPGVYSLQYTHEYTGAGELQSGEYAFQFLVPAPGVAGALGVGGLLALRRRRVR